MSLTSSNSSPDDRRTSRAVACSHCRQRRSFCSKDRPACSRCQAAGLVCRYKEENRVRITESRLRILQTKAEAYDVLVNQPKQRQARTDTLNGDNRDDDHGVNTNDDDDYEEQQPFLDRFNIGFTGPGSSDAFLRSLQRLCGLEEEDDDNNRLDMQFTSLFEPGQLPSRRNLRGTDVRLPPLAMARRLFAAQHSYIGSIFAFTNPADAFEQAMTDAYTFVVRPNPDDDDIETCLRYAKVLVVLAFGQLYSINQWVGFRGPPGFGYFANALQFLPDPHAQPSILFVETLALIGYFFQNLNCVASASMYIGMALRMAMSLGLHQEEVSGCAASGSDYRQSSSTGMLIKNGSAQDDAAREHRRRVWWSVYSLDCILAVKSGSPVTIQDEDIGVQPPSWLPEEIDYRPAAVLWHHTRLSHLLGEIHATIYRRTAAAATTTTATRRRPKERLTTLVERLLTKLSDYKRDLPNELRFDRSWLSITSRESVSIMALYHHCISVAVRPLLSHIVQKRLKEAHTSDYTADEDDESQNRFNWKTGLPRLVIDAIETCVSSAKDVIQMMTLAAERDLVATYGSMDGEHIVSATIVLIMACIALPSITPGEDYNNSSNVATMHAGLRLLRNMGDRGNDHIAARHNRLIAVVQVHSMGQTSSRFVDSAVTSQGSTMDVRAPTSADEPASTDSTFAQPCISSSHGTTSSSLTTIITSNADDTCTMSQFPALDNSLLDELSFYVNNDSMTGVDLTMWEEEGFAGPITITDQAHDGGFSKWSGAGFRDSAGA